MRFYLLPTIQIVPTDKVNQYCLTIAWLIIYLDLKFSINK